MFLLCLFILALCLWSIWIWVKKPSALEPPELAGKLPLIGHAHLFLGDSARFYKSMKRVCDEGQKKGGVIKFYLGLQTFYGVSDPEDTLSISNISLQKHYAYNFLKPVLGNGLITADVQTWKKNRKILNPAFNQNILDGYLETFNKQSRKLVDRFASQLGKPFDQEHWLRINNLETICSVVTGMEAGYYDNLETQYLPCLEDILSKINDRIRMFWLHSDFVYNLSSLKTKIDKSAKQILELSNSIVQKKKTEFKNLTNNKNKTDKSKPFIELMLELSEEHNFTEKYIQAEIDNMIAAGHETTASTLTIALTLLGSHVGVQAKAYDEIRHIFGNLNGDIHKNDMSKLVYIEAILKETLRLYPVVPFIARQLDQDIKLKNYTLKTNSSCVISIYGINRHHIWGSDADQFRPERWLDKETLPDQKYFASFGIGRRSCIGKVFTMMTMKVILVHVLRKFRITSDVSKMVVKIDTTIRPESGFYISLEQRDLKIY